MIWKAIIKDTIVIEKINTITKVLFDNVDMLPNNISLFGNHSGFSLYFYYIHQFYGKIEYSDKANEILEHLVNNLTNATYTYCNGLSGLGWMLCHLQEKGLIEEQDNIFEDVDIFLCKLMQRDIHKGYYDYLHGGLGFANYLLHKLPNPEIEKYLASVVEMLYQQNVSTDTNYVFWNSILNPIREANEAELIGVNLGLSHGISSVAVILSKFYLLGVEKEKTKYLLLGMLNFIWDSCLDNDSLSRFPNSVVANSTGTPSRLSWCYGDVGMGIALWQVAKVLNHTIYEQKAIDVLVHSTKRRTLKENHIIDSGLCHGSAGLVHIYNRMYQYTGLEVFKETALYWLDILLSQATFEDGLAGYKAYHVKEWKNEYGVLEGIAGIGLVLMAACSDIEPAWDEMLLLSSSLHKNL